jgi:outer membrane protein assembly factor BamB
MLKRFSCCLCLVVLAGLALAEVEKTSSKPQPFDWPQWQGQDRNAMSKETGLLKSWPKDGPPIAWKAKGIGGGYSTPSVAGGRVFGMGSRNNDEAVWALDEANGKELWSTSISPKLARVGYGEGPRGTPTVDGDKLYAVGVDGDLVCLETATGKEVWRTNYKKDLKGKMMSGWGYCESPLIDGKNLICTPGGDDATLAALDKDTGEVKWKAAVPNGGGSGYASIVVSEACGVRQYITLLRSCIVGVSAKDGKFLWRYDKVANGTANIPTPIVTGDMVFCSTGYGKGAALLHLVPTSEAGVKAEEVYFLKGDVFQNHHGGMVLLGNHVYAGHGHNAGSPTCLELKTGKIVWQEKGAGSGSAAIAYADGHLYFRHQNGVMSLVEAAPSGYKETGKFKLPDNSGKASWPHPILANGKLYIRDQDVLLCFDVKEH